MAEKCIDNLCGVSDDDSLNITEEEYELGIAAHKNRIARLKAELRREESQVEHMKRSLIIRKTNNAGAEINLTPCSEEYPDRVGVVSEKCDNICPGEFEDESSGYVTVISVQENQRCATRANFRGCQDNRVPRGSKLSHSHKVQLKSFHQQPNVDAHELSSFSSLNSGNSKADVGGEEGLSESIETGSAYDGLNPSSREDLTEISASTLDDGYASKDRSKSGKRDRVAVQIAPPLVPLRKSFSGEFVEGLISEKESGCSEKSFSCENSGRLPRKESLRMFSSKESLKDSGTSSPRNNSPRFCGGNIGRSNSQSSSGSVTAVSGTRSYLKDLEEPMYETGLANVEFEETPIDFSSDTIKSSGSFDRSFVSSHHESASSLDTTESPRPHPRSSLASSNTYEDYENCEIIMRRNGCAPSTATCVYEGPGKYRLPKADDSVSDLPDDLFPPPLSPLPCPEFDMGGPLCSSSQTLALDAVKSKSLAPVAGGGDDVSAYKKIVASIVQSEESYLKCLSAMMKYLEILKASTDSSKPVVSVSDINSIFFKIPELHHLHSTFFRQLRTATEDWDGTSPIANHFSFLAQNLGVYDLYLRNYNYALSTARRCSEQCSNFEGVTSSIPIGGHKVMLAELLYKPVARVLQTAPVFNDLLANVPPNHPDRKLLQLSYSLAMTQSYVTNDLPRISVNTASKRAIKRDKSDKNPRQLAMNTFVVIKAENQRKLRRLFLFSDALVCTKQQMSSRCQDRDSLEMKWFIPLSDLEVSTSVDAAECLPVAEATLSDIRLRTAAAREMIRSLQVDLNNKKHSKSNARLARERKKLAEFEARLFLLSPAVPLQVNNSTTRSSALFLFSSHFERDKWLSTVHGIKNNTPPCDLSTRVSFECMSSYLAHNRLQLFRSATTCDSFDSRDRFFLSGDLHVILHELIGLDNEQEIMISLEFDSNQLFSRRACTKAVCSLRPIWNEQFHVELSSCTTMRVLCYRLCIDAFNPHPVLIGRCDVELNQSWMTESMKEHSILLNRKVSLRLSLKFLLSASQHCPLVKHGELFGQTIKFICERESRSVPFIITTCVREVERRGLHETGVYRVSGMASNVNQLKKLFNSNMQQAEQMVKEVEIHSVTGLLKLYLRELPEGLFTQHLYGRFVNIFCSSIDQQHKSSQLLSTFAEMPRLNQSIIVYLIEHMLKVHEAESINKMSLNNLATVFGPTLLRSTATMATGPDGEPVADMLTAGAIDVMAQAGVVFFFLHRRFNNEPIQVEMEQPTRFT